MKMSGSTSSLFFAAKRGGDLCLCPYVIVESFDSSDYLSLLNSDSVSLLG